MPAFLDLGVVAMAKRQLLTDAAKLKQPYLSTLLRARHLSGSIMLFDKTVSVVLCNVKKHGGVVITWRMYENEISSWQRRQACCVKMWKRAGRRSNHLIIIISAATAEKYLSRRAAWRRGRSGSNERAGGNAYIHIQ